ncbi:MAG: hypothetical protein ACI83W_000890 [Marinoscillum sp.]|jgi:hypothetical protein
MKKLLNLFLAVLIIGSLANCGTDEKPGDDGLVIDENAPQTPEENKEKLQDIGVDFVSEMSLLQKTASSQTLISFGLLLDEAEPNIDGRVVKGIDEVERITKSLHAVAYRVISLSDFAGLSSTVAQEDPETLQDLWDDYKGEFAWNASTQEWDYTKGGAVVKFSFPSSDDETTNNAALTIRNYEGITIAGNPLDESEEYVGDLPKKLTMDLMIDGIKEMEYSFDINYTSDGEPEKVLTALFMNPFTLAISLTNNDVKVANSFTFKNAEKTLIAVAAEANGNFDEEVIDQVDESEDPTDVVKTASASVTLLDVKFTASLDLEKLYNEVGDLDTYYDSYSEGSKPDLEGNADKMEVSLNKYAPLTVSYVSSNSLAASAEWYTFVESYQDGSYSEEYIELGARMVFADGSKVDIEDYFESGFSELEGVLNDLIDALGNDIGEEIEHINFD